MEIVDSIVNPPIRAAQRAGRALRFSLASLMVFAVLQGPPQARAQDRIARLDPAQTTVAFTLADVLHTVHGTFKLKSGEIRFNPRSGAIAGNVIVDATSGESGNATCDRKMHREVLESAQFPEITFTPTRCNGVLSAQGISRIEVTGEFTMHGQRHDVTFPMEIQADRNQLRIESQMVLPYVNWGVKNPSTFILHVSDKVTLDIRATVSLEDADHAP